jgi:hypothetical protein
MKKLLILVFLFSISLSLSAQWYGDGLSAGTAFYGVINSTYPMQTWNITNYPGGVVYVGRSTSGQNDLEIGTGGTLTISQGITVKFCTISSDLRITGTGVLNASGSSSSLITFTKNAQATWGHISFEASTGNSIINYSIVEYGYKNGTTIEGYGGGIHANTSTLAITNCIIRNNYAQWGGGIFVNASKNPSISNCNIYNNQSLHAGGGIYCWNYSSSVITNCIFEGNSCLETTTAYYTGGGLAAQANCAIKVVNCTFVNNTSTRPEGHGIMLHSSPNSRVINSIFWGASDKQIYCYFTTSSFIINCAYRGITYSTGTPVNPIVLNSSNTAADGPNFVTTNGSDWSIKYVSPCRDKGVDTYTGVTIPTLDYPGNSRISTTDIGAYEVQYCRWKTTAATTDWTTAGNWDGGVPTNTRDVVIPTGATNYPIGSPAQDFTVASGKIMILEPGSRLTLNNLTNNGSLKLNASASGFSSLLINNYSRGAGATEEIQLYLSGGGDVDANNFKWHYISTPVSSLATNTFTSVTLDLAQYVESRPSLSLMQGWVAYDGYVYSTGQSNGPTFSTLTPGKGYDFWDNADNTFTFSGQFNTSNVAMSLGYSGTPSLHGFNLLGNPFPSGLNWDDIANSVYFPYPASTSKGLYFTRGNTQCTYIGGVGTPGDVTGIIPPMQGFFTKTYSAGNTITLPAAARTNSGIHSTYKGSSGIPLVRLQFSKDTINYDETVVRFDDYAKPELDYDFDAMKMFLSSSKNQIYSSLAGTNFAINGVPFPAPETFLEVPIVINTTATGSYKISCIQLQALDGFDVVLEDKVTGTSRNLKIISLMTFSSEAGTIADRFVLKVGDNILTGIDDIDNRVANFNIYSSDNFINVVPLDDEWSDKTGSVNVFDLTGRSVGRIDNVGFHQDVICQIGAPGAKGMYVVEIRSGVKRYVGKVVIR